MARKSGWQQFADNFTSTYDVVNKFGKDRAINDIMDQEVEEQFGEDGASTGFTVNGRTYGSMDDVTRANNASIAKVYSKFGDSTGGLQFQRDNAALSEQKNQNRMFRETFDTQRDQYDANLGLSKSQIAKLEADLVAANKRNDLTEATQPGVIANTNASNEANVGDSNRKIEANTMLEAYRAKSAIPFGETGGYANQEERFTSFVDEYAKVHGDEAAGKFAVSFGQNGLALLEQETDKVRLGFDKVLRTGDVNELKAYVDDFNGANNVELQTGKDGSLVLLETTPEGAVVNTTTGKNLKDLQDQLKGRVDEKGAMAAAKYKLDNQLTESTIALNKAKETSGIKFNAKYWAKERLKTHPNDLVAQRYAGFVDGEENVGQRINYSQNLSPSYDPKGDGAGGGAGGGAGDSEKVPVNNAGLSGVTKTQIDKTASMNTQKNQSRKSSNELYNRVSDVYATLSQDLVPYTLDNNLSAKDYKAQKERDEVLAWVQDNAGTLNGNDGYFRNAPSKLAAFENDPVGWYNKNIKSSNEKGLK